MDQDKTPEYSWQRKLRLMLILPNVLLSKFILPDLLQPESSKTTETFLEPRNNSWWVTKSWNRSWLLRLKLCSRGLSCTDLQLKITFTLEELLLTWWIDTMLYLQTINILCNWMLILHITSIWEMFMTRALLNGMKIWRAEWKESKRTRRHFSTLKKENL